MTKNHSKTIQIQRICQLTYLEQTNGLELKTLEPTKLGFQYLVVNLFEDGLWSHPFELINQKLAAGYVNPVYYQEIMDYLAKPKTIQTNNIPIKQHLFIMGRLQPTWYDPKEQMIYETIR